MGDEILGGYDLNSFRNKHPALIERHQGFLKEKAYDVTDKLAQTILECAKLAVSRPKAERDDTFLHAFIFLASKVISHLEGARLLLDVGRYGDVAIIARGLLSDVMTIQYLSLSSNEESAAWFELAKSRPVTGAHDPAYRRLLEQFSEGRMRLKIAEAGQRPISSRESFGAYSEAVHAGSWGLQFYAFQELGPSGNFAVQFGPTYQPLIALRKAAVVGALALQVTEDFLSWCEERGVDWHRHVLDEWRPIQAEAIRALQSCMDAATLAHKEFFS